MARAATAVSDTAAYYGRPKKDRRSAPNKLRAFMESANVAADLPEGQLAEIGARAHREYEVDENSRSDWKTRMKDALDLAMQVTGEKNYPWPNAANIKFPLVTTAAVQFAARAYPAIVNNRSVVKGQVRGEDEGVPATDPQSGQPVMDPQTGQPAWQVEPGAKRERAERVARHMSWQLLDEMEEWEEDTDLLLHVLPILGCCFRKTWFDPAMGRCRSEMITPDKAVVNYKAKSLATAPRITQRFDLYPYEIEERVRSGLYLECEYGPTGETNDDDAPHCFLEQHRWLDLDDDGYPEPYVVTLHEETHKVVRIVARFDAEGVFVNDRGEVAKIEPVQYFTRYLFMPAPDGGIYGVGFGALLQPLNEAINSTINQMLDAGHLQNTGGGFIGYGLKIRGGNLRFAPGEYKRVQTIAGGIRENVVPLTFPGPSATLFSLLGLLIEAARDISSVKDIMTGDEGPPGEAAARTLARIEQGMKVFSAIYKRIFRGLKHEYAKLFRLNRLYLDERVYFTLLDTPEAVALDDYQSDDLDVVPVADPNMVTDAQRMAQAEFLLQFLGDPYFDPRESRKRVLDAVGMPDGDKLLVQELPPDPEIAAKADEMEVRKREVEIKAQAQQVDAEKSLAEVAEIKSRVILNLAKAEHESDKTEIETLSTLLDSILERRRQAIEIAKASDATDLKKREIDAKTSERRGVRELADPSGNGAGPALSA